jgi:glycosyltransferase involved in cell wall biosynthesis
MVRKLSILVPIYNEAATVEILLRRLLKVPFQIDREIVAIDDGSTDGTESILRSFVDERPITLVHHEKNRGKGAAIRTGIEHTTGDVIVIQDADLELDPAELPRLLEPILSGRAQVCFGSRFLAGVSWSMRCRPTYWANAILNSISNLLNGIRITDFNTCYKMMTDNVMAQISITQNGFAMEPEITAKIARLGYEIVERPVSYRPRSANDGKKIRFADAVRCLRAMVYYRFFWSPETAYPTPGTISQTVSKPVAEFGMAPSQPIQPTFRTA